MKILIATILLGALGAGSYLYAKPAAVAEVAPSAAQSCNPTVTCTPEGTCRVECQEATGTACSIEVECAVECAPICQPNCAPACK